MTRETADVWSPELRRAWIVAAHARRFGLIARRPEFLAEDERVRAAHALADDAPGPLPLFDAAQAIGSSGLDRLCGYAVSVLSRQSRGIHAVLDVLGMLDADRLCGIYFALPPKRRAIVRRDPVWGYHVQQVEPHMAEAEERLDDLIDGPPTSGVGYAIARIEAELS